MPVLIEELSARVTLDAGDVVLTDAQVEQIVDKVLHRLAERQRHARQSQRVDAIRESVIPDAALQGRA